MRSRPSATRLTGSSSGFTLIELLTTLTIVGLVAGAIAASFGSSIRVRRAARSQIDRLAEVQILARQVREDVEHIVAVPHALYVDGGTLAILRWNAPPPGESADPGGMSIVCYRRHRGPGGEGPLLREVQPVDDRVLRSWSKESLAPGPASVLRPVVQEGLSTPVFRLPEPVEWKALEYGDGEWRVSDGERQAAIRAVDLRIRSLDVPSTSASGPPAGVRGPWTFRIPLPLRLPEGVGS